MEKFYAFIKNNRVEQVAVFESQNEELANMIVQEKGFDSAVWLGENSVAMWSEYVNGEFINPTLDYLYSIGVSNENQAMRDARILAQMEENNL